jgi:hypothetical protein
MLVANLKDPTCNQISPHLIQKRASLLHDREKKNKKMRAPFFFA